MAIGFTYIGCRCGATEGGRWDNGGDPGKEHRVIGHYADLSRTERRRSYRNGQCSDGCLGDETEGVESKACKRKHSSPV
jgi:hypothetical protein